MSRKDTSRKLMWLLDHNKIKTEKRRFTHQLKLWLERIFVIAA